MLELDNASDKNIFMCLKKKVLLDLCQYYPKTSENLRIRSLIRRSYFHKTRKAFQKTST